MTAQEEEHKEHPRGGIINAKGLELHAILHNIHHETPSTHTYTHPIYSLSGPHTLYLFSFLSFLIGSNGD